MVGKIALLIRDSPKTRAASAARVHSTGRVPISTGPALSTSVLPAPTAPGSHKLAGSTARPGPDFLPFPENRDTLIYRERHLFAPAFPSARRCCIRREGHR